MESIPIQICRFLVAAGLGVFDELGSGGMLYHLGLPPEPDEAVAVRPTGGFNADPLNAYERPTVQILVRGTADSRTGEVRAQAIYDALHGLRHQLLCTGGNWIVSCSGIQSGPNYIGPDENGRHIYSLNFQLITRSTTRRN